jgi:hypothetical protein
MVTKNVGATLAALIPTHCYIGISGSSKDESAHLQGDHKGAPLLWTSLASRFVGIVGAMACPRPAVGWSVRIARLLAYSNTGGF